MQWISIATAGEFTDPQLIAAARKEWADSPVMLQAIEMVASGERDHVVVEVSPGAYLHVRAIPVLSPAQSLRLVREFLALPSSALPGAEWDDPELGGAWEALRAADERGTLSAFISPMGETSRRFLYAMRLRAARPGWREGLVLYMQPAW